MLSFKSDIRPLFTQEDVDHMLDVDPDLDLSSFESVKENANDIYRVVSSGAMPPGDPWPKDRVEKFKQWMDDGYSE